MKNKAFIIQLLILILCTGLILPEDNKIKNTPSINPEFSDQNYIYLEDRKHYLINKYRKLDLQRSMVIKILPAKKGFSFNIPVSSIKEITIDELKILKRKNIKYVSYNLKTNPSNRYISYIKKENNLQFQIKSTEVPLILYVTYSRKYKNKVYALNEKFERISNIFQKEIKVSVHKDIPINSTTDSILKRKQSYSYSYKTYIWKLNYMKNPIEENIDLNIMFYNSFEDLTKIITSIYYPHIKESDLYKKLIEKDSIKNITNYFKNIKYSNQNGFILKNISPSNFHTENDSLYCSILLSEILKTRGSNSDPVIFFETEGQVDRFQDFPFLSDNFVYGILIKRNNSFVPIKLSNSTTNHRYTVSLKPSKNPIQKIHSDRPESFSKINYNLNIVNKHLVKISVSRQNNKLEYDKIKKKLFVKNKNFIEFNKNSENLTLICKNFIKEQNNYLIIDIDSLFDSLNSSLIKTIKKGTDIASISQTITINIPDNYKFIIYPKYRNLKNRGRISRKTDNAIYIQQYPTQDNNILLSIFKGEILLLKKDNSFIYNIF